MSTLKTPITKAAEQKSQADGNPSKPDLYQQVTELILAQLENGVVPWRCPLNREVGRPRNFHSGHPYQGSECCPLGMSLCGIILVEGERGAMVVKAGTFNLGASTPSSVESMAWL